MRALAASPCALVFLSLLFKPRAPTLYLFELLSKTLWSAEAPGAAGVGVCALAVLAGHPWSARTGRAWRIARSTSFGASRIARSTSFGAGNLAGKPRAPKHWCHCQNSVLSNLPLQPRAPALRAKRLTPLHRTGGSGHYDHGSQQVLRLRRWASAMILRIATAHLPNARSVVVVRCLCGSNVPLQAAHHAAVVLLWFVLRFDDTAANDLPNGDTGCAGFTSGSCSRTTSSSRACATLHVVDL